ncbi:MAG: phenyltransferase domain-containing protein [Deltaproteobacteria bacterium SG8_13]|nr:MAG: phenyltransferase domain-containing protein [Deltaproteobacteria bacterium SG8_13]
MKLDATGKKQDLGLDITRLSAQIAKVQQTSGEIPWCIGKKTDPWDHVEAAMGLSIGGWLVEAQAAYAWMAANQNPDGSWFAAYRQGRAQDRTRDANMSAYIAVGVLQHYLITGDVGFLRKLWPVVNAAIDFALSLQSAHGDIYWAISPAGRVDRMALLTGSSSICMSIKCALAIGRHLGHSRPSWQEGLRKLENAILHKPHRFNMTKSRYSMDWYYPVLCGAVTGPLARERIDRHWKRYVIDGQGVRCVFDAPWITIAETCELALALVAMGDLPLARVVFNWIGDKRYEDGCYWAGHTFPDMTVWPEDKLSWTNAVVLMAVDALYELTPASRLFSHRHWNDTEP